jgi:hypothetical protein
MSKTYQLASIFHEFTLEFVKLYLGDVRTKEKATLLAGSIKENVAPASLKRLYEIYTNFIAVKDLELWPSYSLKLRKVKGIAFRPYKSYKMYEPFLASPEAAANAAICLLNQISSSLEKGKAPLTTGMYYY